MKPEFTPPSRTRNGGRPDSVASISKRDAALGQRADFGGGQCEVVGGERDRLGVEVAARQHFAGVRENQRIVGDGIGFQQQHVGGVAHLVQTRAHHLRLAAQAVRVLHLVAIGVRNVDARALQQRAVSRRRVDLTLMAAQFVNARVERLDRTHRRVDRQRTGHQRGAEQVFDREHVVERERGRCLRAVEQRQTFLRLQRERLQADQREAFGGRHALALREHFTDAEQRRRHMRERREVARCADRTLDRDHRQHVGVVQRDQRFHHFAADARVTAAETRQLQRDQQTHDRTRHRLTHADRVRQHQIALQQFELVARDMRAGEPPEAGVDAVGRLALRGDVGDGLRAGVDGGVAGGIELQRDVLACDLAQLRESQKTGLQNHDVVLSIQVQ